MREFVQALRDAADWFEAHPDIPTPQYHVLNVFPPKEDIEIVVKSCGGSKKLDFGSFLGLRRQFGEESTGMAVDINFDRSEVCTRRVVGTKVVPEHTIPAHIKEIVEWDCNPLLRK